MKKRYFLIALIIMSIISTKKINAQELGVDYHINPLYNDVITEEDLKEINTAPTKNSDEYYSENKESTLVYNTTYEAAAKVMREQIKSRQDEVIVGIQTENNWKDVYNSIWNQVIAHTGNPTEGDYILWNYGGYRVSCRYDDYNSKKMSCTYYMTYYTNESQEAELTEELNKVMVLLNLNNLDDYQKITKIYDYITQNITYDYTNLSDSEYKLKYTAYAALVNKTSVCQGYALLFYRMALTANVDTRIITGIGNGGGHAWNIVKLGNYYYNLDSTWDAPYGEIGAKYNWYLKNEKNFTNHTRDDEYSNSSFNSMYPMSSMDYEYNPQIEIKNGLHYNDTTKRYEYYKNGYPDYTYNGVATNENGTWYVNRGIITFTHNEVVYYDGAYRAFVNSKLTINYTGLLSNSYGNWYLQNGTVDFGYNGAYKDTTGNIYQIKSGQVNPYYTGIYSVGNTWYYFNKGKTDFKYSGVSTNQYGTWYVDRGIVTFTHNETILYQGAYRAFINSMLSPKYTGVLSNSYGNWYLQNGIVTFGYNGKVTIDGKTYTVINSKVIL